MLKLLKTIAPLVCLLFLLVLGCPMPEDEPLPTPTPPPAANNPPVAVAGADQVVVLGNSVTLNGSGSSDPDLEAIVTYSWTLGDGNTGTGILLDHTYAATGGY